MLSLKGADRFWPGWTQAVLFDEVMPKHMVIHDQVVTKEVWIQVRARSKGVVFVNVSPQVGNIRSLTLISQRRASYYLSNRKRSTQGI